MTGIQVLPPDKSYESELAKALMAQGEQAGPVYSPMQGIGKLAQALAGKYLSGQVQDNQKQRQDAMTANLQTAVQGATKPDGTLDSVALGKALMGQPETASMGLQMLTSTAEQQAKAKAANPGYRQLDPSDPADKAQLAKLPPGSYQQDMDPNSPTYKKIEPTGSQSAMMQPPADPSQPLNSRDELLAKGLVNGTVDPKSPMMRYIGPNVTARAQFLDPSFTMQNYPTQFKARSAFAPGGQYNKNLVALGTAAQHIDLLKQYVSAMQNGDVPSMNKLTQLWQTQTGSALPTNFDAIKSTVAAEVAKANGEASLGALDQIQAPLNKSGSPAQLFGALQGFQGLMSGKVASLRQQYTASGLGSDDQFNKKFFTPEAQTMFTAQQPSQTQGGKPASVIQNGNKFNLVNGQYVYAGPAQ